jgi:hypothetical protein
MSNSRELTAPGMYAIIAFPLRELLAPGYFGDAMRRKKLDSIDLRQLQQREKPADLLNGQHAGAGPPSNVGHFCDNMGLSPGLNGSVVGVAYISQSHGACRHV